MGSSTRPRTSQRTGVEATMFTTIKGLRGQGRLRREAVKQLSDLPETMAPGAAWPSVTR